MSIGDDQHAVAGAGVHRVESHDRVAAVGSVQVERLHQQQLTPLVIGVLLGGHQFPDHARDQHGAFSAAVGLCTRTESTMPTTVASVGASTGRNGAAASLLRTQ